ncbi:nucleotidyltransferase domain-containing protein [Dethiothermospora halolimnae]|uniref:nucleotidyltransferase domain-containing protein n=1 Tax=Dethiothermospora halolimnae TaxID=3114390 RepID=UPI003CCC258E
MRDIGIDWDDLKRYVKEQIYTLPGIKNHKDKLTVLLTGSRAIGTYSKGSDVDIDVICTKEVYNKIQSEMVERGLTTNKKVAFYYLPKIGWDKYFGKEVGQPHISITNIDIIKEQIKSFEDVPVWIWSNAVIINDPRAQFKRIISLFKEYPMEVLKRKVKYRYLLSLYWLIDVYPHNHSKTDEVFSGTLAIVNGINELYKFFYLIEGKSFLIWKNYLYMLKQQS